MKLFIFLSILFGFSGGIIRTLSFMPYYLRGEIRHSLYWDYIEGGLEPALEAACFVLLVFLAKKLLIFLTKPKGFTHRFFGL